jgi:uncharacterized protein YlxW (UPF0749 family)
MKINRNASLTLVCVILGIVIAWQFKSINNNQKTSFLDDKSLNQLRDELILQKKSNEELVKRNYELKDENLKYENAKGNDSVKTQLLQDELNRVRIISGLVDVKGKGLKVTIDLGESTFIEDLDILRVINELRASDAQAISINEERIVAMSEIRSAGRYIMVNQKQLLPPFEIKAIADPEKLEHALTMMDGVIDILKGYQLDVKVEKSDNITILKVNDDGSVIKTDLLNPVESN